ncbi:MAG: hypothetical protein Q9208_007344 [Pyrenodesmia sp. 3 TL-2023]
MPAPPVPPLVPDISIGNLPLELQHMIMENCTYASYNALGLTDNYFRDVREGYLLHKESCIPYYPAFNSFPCYSCGQFLFWLEFADAEKRGNKARSGTEAKTRICLLCALKEKKHPPGDMVMHCGREQYVCRTCNKFCGIYQTTPPVPYCRPEPVQSAPWSDEMIQSASKYNVWAGMRPQTTPRLPMPASYLREYRQQQELKRMRAGARKAKGAVKRAKATIAAAKAAPKETKAAIKVNRGTIKAAKATIKGAMATIRKAKTASRKAAIKAAASSS